MSTAKNATTQNPMHKVVVSKVTLNVGAGKSEVQLKKALKLLRMLTDVAPVTTRTTRRIPAWGLRPGLAIGAKATIRKDCIELLKKLLAARENKLSPRCFDNSGNFSFGVAEYIDIPGLEYDPELKIMGLEVAVTLERPGYRVKRRTLFPKKVGEKHRVHKEEAMNFAQEVLGAELN